MLPRLRQRYAARGKEGWSKIIDELCDQFGYSRKHALKLMGAKSSWRCVAAKRSILPNGLGIELLKPI